MPKQFYGSICLTDLLIAAKKPHSAFNRGNNGKAYANINVWINDEPDRYGNIISLQLSSTKEKFGTEEKIYFGRAKENPPKGNPKGKKASSDPSWSDDLPF